MSRIHILSGPIQSGKTTQLHNWIEKRTDVGGLLSPIKAGKRYFLNLKTCEEKPMEAMVDETDVQMVGRYTFSGITFYWANQVLLKAAQDPTNNYLIIDEIGPLELWGKGLAPALQQILPNLPENLKVILVIRETLVESVISHFTLPQSSILPFPPKI